MPPLQDVLPPKETLWRYAAALFASRTSHGDRTVCLERVAFWLTFLLCASRWGRGIDIPATLASFLNVLVAAVLGQGVLSTVGMVTRKTVDPLGEAGHPSVDEAQNPAAVATQSHTYPS